MTEIRVPSQAMFNDINAMRRKVLGTASPQGQQPTPSPAEPLWYYAELLTDVDAPSNAWTDPQIGYAKLMVPDSSDGHDPKHFTELGTGPITDATNASPIVITSGAHGLRNGALVYITGVAGNTAANGPFTIANATLNTFELVGSTGNGAYSGGGDWYMAPRFTNRSVGMRGSTGTACKLEYAWGEWTLKWIDC